MMFWKNIFRPGFAVMQIFFVCLWCISCGQENTADKKQDSKPKDKSRGQATVKGKILNPERNYVVLRNRANMQAKRDSVVLGSDGEFRFTVDVDTLTGYSIMFSDPKAATPRTPANPDPEPNLSISEMSIVLDKGYDLEVTIDAKDPPGNFSVSGAGAELAKYAANKAFKGTIMNKQQSHKLRSSPEEYLSFIDAYYSDMKKLINDIPSGTGNVPPGFKEREDANLNYFYYRLKINLAFDDLKKGPDGKYANDESFISFMKEVPFDKPEEVSNSAYNNLISSYADFILRKGNPGKVLTIDERLSMKYDLYKELFKDPATRDRMLYDYLVKYASMNKQPWHINAVQDFEKTAVSDSLKKEAGKIKDIVPGKPQSEEQGN